MKLRPTAKAAAQVAAKGKATGNAHQACIVAIMGASGSGKTFNLVARIKKLPARQQSRTIIWSPKEPADNYAALFPGSVVVRDVRAALEIIKKAGAGGGFHIVFWPSLNRKADQIQFDALCRIAMAARNVTFIADELHTVTMPSWAPDGWSQLVMMGRAYGCCVFGLSQRPASMDKDFLGNCSLVRTGRLPNAQDAAAVARALNVRPDEVLALSGYQAIERDTLTGIVTRH